MPTHNRNNSDLLPAMHARFTLCRFSDWTRTWYLGAQGIISLLLDPQNTWTGLGNSHTPSSTLKSVKSWSSVPWQGSKPHCSTIDRTVLLAPWHRLYQGGRRLWSSGRWNTPWSPFLKMKTTTPSLQFQWYHRRCPRDAAETCQSGQSLNFHSLVVYFIHPLGFF